jgi:hypothetical protein
LESPLFGEANDDDDGVEEEKLLPREPDPDEGRDEGTVGEPTLPANGVRAEGECK